MSALFTFILIIIQYKYHKLSEFSKKMRSKINCLQIFLWSLELNFPRDNTVFRLSWVSLEKFTRERSLKKKHYAKYYHNFNKIIAKPLFCRYKLHAFTMNYLHC